VLQTCSKRKFFSLLLGFFIFAPKISFAQNYRGWIQIPSDSAFIYARLLERRGDAIVVEADFNGVYGRTHGTEIINCSSWQRYDGKRMRDIFPNSNSDGIARAFC